MTTNEIYTLCGFRMPTDAKKLAYWLRRPDSAYEVVGIYASHYVYRKK